MTTPLESMKRFSGKSSHKNENTSTSWLNSHQYHHHNHDTKMLSGKIDWPRHIDPVAKDLIKKFLVQVLWIVIVIVIVIQFTITIMTAGPYKATGQHEKRDGGCEKTQVRHFCSYKTFEHECKAKHSLIEKVVQVSGLGGGLLQTAEAPNSAKGRLQAVREICKLILNTDIRLQVSYIV